MSSLRLLRCALLVIGCLSATPFLAAKDQAPAWLATLAATPATVPAGDAAAVILLHDAALEVLPDGTFVTRTRWAVRVLNADGRKHATASHRYNSSSETVKSFNAWLLPPAGDPVAFKKKRVVDTMVYSNARELYGEIRAQTLHAQDEAAPGAVFGYEAVVEERSVQSGVTWVFDSPLPVERSRFSLKLAPGWQVTTHTFNHPPVPPVTEGRTQTWELTRRPAFSAEPFSPPPEGLAPWIAVELTPPPGSSKVVRRRAGGSWQALSVAQTPVYLAAAAFDAPMKARAATLLGGAATPWEGLRALCLYAQQVNYISILLDSANAGGITPRPATRVFQCNYGDCKDKSTLLIALLSSQGLTAYPVAVFAGNAQRVRPEWPSYGQFNHCIVAIKVDASVEGPAVLAHPELGRLLFFDPTAEFTVPGLLPVSLYGSRGLLFAGEQGGLVTLPAAKDGSDQQQRTVRVQLTGTGGVAGFVEERFLGNAADAIRSGHQRVTATDYQKQTERWLATTLPAPRTAQITVKDDPAEGRLTRSLEFASAGYGKPMRDVLLVFKPALLARRDHVLLRPGKKRQLPVVLNATSFTEQVVITLPAGFEVDEAMPPADIQAPFGTYRSRATLAGGTLVYERSVEFKAATIPAAEYETVRAFFEKMQQAEQTPVVLRRMDKEKT